MIDIKDFAKKISGCEYPARELSGFFEEAKANGFLVIYGMSDDLLMFGGLYSDERDACDGATAKIGTRGVKVEAVWSPDEFDGTSWLINIDCDHEKFTIMEDETVFCYGVVVHESQLNKNSYAGGLVEVQELEYIRLPNGTEVRNCKALFIDGKLDFVSVDHALFDKIVEGMKK